ncbi:MAG: FliA/WhiG family RNA polymerase sigma factor [Acidobacteriota bacterium]|nr:FliA/WhiG family RNA polymerase sigma factor [Acidobacteriota bacterium]
MKAPKTIARNPAAETPCPNGAGFADPRQPAVKGQPAMTPLKAVKRNYQEVSDLDQEERDRILMENLPQVHYIAKRIHDRLPPHVPIEDLVNAGIVGLLEAIQHFDPARGAQVKTYAELRIHGAILDSLREMDWGPRAVRRKGRLLEESHNRLRQAFGRPPSEQELAGDMQISLKELRALLCDLRGLNVGSIQAMQQENGNGDQLFKYMPNSPDQDPFYLCLQSELKQCLEMAVDDLPEREKQLLALYYKEELTMKEVGAVLGIGEGRVSQIHSAAMARLRAQMKSYLGEGRAMAAESARPEGDASWKKF